MAIIGNIVLSLATLFFFVIVSAVLGKEPARGGDGAGGYAMGVLLFFLAFFVCMIIATIAIAWKGGFDWISADKSTRYWLVALGLFSTVATAAVSALFKYEPGGVPVLIRIFSAFVPIMIPLVLLVCGFILLNSGLRDMVPLAAYKWPLSVVFVLGILGLGSGIYMWIATASENNARVMEARNADQARYHQGFLDEIANCDVTKGMANILVFTDSNHDEDIRAAAVAKVKTNPQWQQELVRLLENKGAAEAFNFLASNEVDDKSLFLEPVNKGVLSIAQWIRREIRNASYTAFYPDWFVWEVDRCLRTVDKLEGLGKGYVPAVRELRAALDEPSSVEKVKLNCTSLLDTWLKKHQ